MSQPIELLEQVVRQLMEHFDCVQIVATTREDDGSTTCHPFGAGNWFARKGSIEHWLITVNESLKERVRICENIEDEDE